MVKLARTIGGAGTGKTSELLSIVEKIIERVKDPTRIGFVSFTRAARKEAMERAAVKFGWDLDALESEGWFRTLHSVCYRCLGVKEELITDTVKSRRWLAEQLGEDAGSLSPSLSEDGGATVAESKTDAAKALRIWELARNRLETLEAAWNRARQSRDVPPPLRDCAAVINRYETAKRVSNRLDFTDLLSQFAGIRFTTEGPNDTEPCGETPPLDAWILDEAQDTSALSGKVFERLVHNGVTRWAYCSGDPFQAVFRFAGADHRIFMGWQADKERIAPKSYRCPAPVLELGERILRRCSDYFDRKIQPADHPGEVVRGTILQRIAAEAKPDESWLFLVRAKYQVAQVGRLLDEHAIPWHGTKGGGWLAPKRNQATLCLLAMEQGQPARPTDWAAVLDWIKLDAKREGVPLLTRGVKAVWNRFKPLELAEMPDVPQEHWEKTLGCTPALIERIRSGRWRKHGDCLVPYADRYYHAFHRFGPDAADTTKVRVGTIHSSKGSQADNVVVLTTTTERCHRETETPGPEQDAEHRVWYVAATRAIKRLFVCREDATERGRKPEYLL